MPSSYSSPPHHLVCGSDRSRDEDEDGRRDCKSVRRKHLLLVLLGIMQNALLGGVIFGWACIDRGLLVAPTWAGGAGLNPGQLSRCFAAASCTAMCGTLVMGWVLDRFGPRACSVVSHLSIAAGCGWVWVSHAGETFCGLVVATCLVALGGPGIGSSIVHLANLFPSCRFLLLSCLSGAICLSFAVFAVFDIIWEHYGGTVTYRDLFAWLGGLALFSLAASVLAWPDEPYQEAVAPLFSEAQDKETDGCGGVDNNFALVSEDDLQLLCDAATTAGHRSTPEEDYVRAETTSHHLVEQPLDSYLREPMRGEDPRSLRRHASYLLSMNGLKRAAEAVVVDEDEREDCSVLVSLKDRPFWHQVSSSTYVRAFVFFVTCCFLANFYVASISTEMADQQYFSAQEQHELARFFTLFISGGVLCSVVVGWVMDRVGLELCLVATVVLGQAQMAILVFFPENQSWMKASFACHVLFRQFVFPVFLATLTSHLGFKYFGLLSGLGYAASGIAQFFMADAIRLVQGGDCHPAGRDSYDSNEEDYECQRHGYWKQLHVAVFLVLTALLLVPLLDYWEGRRLRERIQRALGARRQLGRFGSSPSLSAHSNTTNNYYGAVSLHNIKQDGSTYGTSQYLAD